MSSTKKESPNSDILKRIEILVNPNKTTKPGLQDDDELRLLCRKLVGL